MGIQQEAKQTSECARFPGTDLPAEIGRWPHNEERYVRVVISDRNKNATRSSGMGERGGLLAALEPLVAICRRCERWKGYFSCGN